MKEDKKRVLYIVLFVFWMGVIFFFSSIPGLKSNLPAKYDFSLRKCAHFLEYFVLMFFTLKIFAKGKLNNKKFDLEVLFCFLVVLFYAISDEFHQSFVADRYFAIKDIIIDFSGGVVGYVACKLLDKDIKLKKKS